MKTVPHLCCELCWNMRTTVGHVGLSLSCWRSARISLPPLHPLADGGIFLTLSGDKKWLKCILYYRDYRQLFQFLSKSQKVRATPVVLL